MHRHRPTNASDPVAAQEAAQRALARRGVDGGAEVGPNQLVRVRRSIPGEPLVSIVIPTRGRLDLLRPCVDSILERTRWRRFEIRVVDNGSRDAATLEYLARLPAPHCAVQYPGCFNWSALNDFAASGVRGGAVGAKLLYPDGRVQHAGVAPRRARGGRACLPARVGRRYRSARDGGGDARGERRHRGVPHDRPPRLRRARRVRRAGPGRVRGRRLCLRARALGLATLVTPHARLHHESATCRHEPPGDAASFCRRWGALVARGDPYHHPLIGIDREDRGSSFSQPGGLEPLEKV